MTQDIQIKSWHGEIPVHYLYTYGLAGEKFFRELKDRGVFVGTKCSACNVTYLPPRIYCERCFAELKDYSDFGIKGKVETYTICHETADGSHAKKPVIIAFIKIDGTDGGLIHRLSGVKPADVKFGMKVEAVLAEPAKRAGGINDILHFRAV